MTFGCGGLGRYDAPCSDVLLCEVCRVCLSRMCFMSLGAFRQGCSVPAKPSFKKLPS